MSKQSSITTPATTLERKRTSRVCCGAGSIIGRNSFQRPKADAVRFLQTIMGIYAGEIE
jgi:class I fructose-bisphosphate aldolase